MSAPRQSKQSPLSASYSASSHEITGCVPFLSEPHSFPALNFLSEFSWEIPETFQTRPLQIKRRCLHLLHSFFTSRRQVEALNQTQHPTFIIHHSTFSHVLVLISSVMYDRLHSLLCHAVHHNALYAAQHPALHRCAFRTPTSLTYMHAHKAALHNHHHHPIASSRSSFFRA